MAEIARNLPKWQAEQILCQTAPSKYHAKQKNIFLRFSLFLFFDNADIECRISEKEKEIEHV
jgi:hypothetical protein